MPDHTIVTPKRYQCRHIFTDGHRCGSPCLRREELCYYHHTTRRPIENPGQRRARQASFDLPLPEDRSAIQHAIGEVLLRIAANAIDPRRAGLLLYGLQIASLNLPKVSEAKRDTTPVEEIVAHPQLGTLAPQSEVAPPEKRPGIFTALLEELARNRQHPTQGSSSQTQPEPAESEITEAEPAFMKATPPKAMPAETSEGMPTILPVIQAREAVPIAPHARDHNSSPAYRRSQTGLKPDHESATPLQATASRLSTSLQEGSKGSSKRGKAASTSGAHLQYSYDDHAIFYFSGNTAVGQL